MHYEVLDNQKSDGKARYGINCLEANAHRVAQPMISSDFATVAISIFIKELA